MKWTLKLETGGPQIAWKEADDKDFIEGYRAAGWSAAWRGRTARAGVHGGLDGLTCGRDEGMCQLL